MRYQNIVMLFILSIFSVSVAAGGYADKPTAQASELSKKYVMADESAKPSVLQDFDHLARDNPDNVNVIRSYTSILSSRGEYEKAISLLEPVNKARNNPSLLLQECMLKDRIKNGDAACYKHVISLSERSGSENMDYLMALFFTDDGRFEAEKKKLAASNPSLSRDFGIFDQDKRQLLLSLYP
ncbi:hypothetical protein N7922_05295 [Kosakonia sp. ML.JS2a]|uniref:hypothetical protein n=1 Tax=Kosakonia sp. ML.JS2a TaxID=2980557 RepID=UPI0021DB730B|nr:hypothetical protein [Kosakonia sp. ML.JS2a]UXY11949.1 hypothetical protein N7922_05295 [Kosakonia sp. ML.JS2a]